MKSCGTTLVFVNLKIVTAVDMSPASKGAVEAAEVFLLGSAQDGTSRAPLVPWMKRAGRAAR